MRFTSGIPLMIALSTFITSAGAGRDPGYAIKLIKIRHGQDNVYEETADARSFAAFQKWYYDSIGKSVTVVVQEEEQTNIFAFTVK